jgi:surface polysaccharide O-acyltransferase-like enzyme
VPSIRELAGRTPAGRRRDLDLLRAAAIIAVVVGHWLIVTVERDGGLTGFSALPHLVPAHPLTWLFQVMPVFFLVGGAANAISWSRHRDDGAAGPAGTWLLDRSARLLPPVTTFLVVVAGSAAAARVAGVSPDAVAQAVGFVTLPLWFLVVFFGVVALTPVTYRWHERYGLAAVAVLLVGVAVGDVLRFTTGDELWAAGSFAFGWLAVYQTGFSWRDGSLMLTRRRAAALLAGGVVALALLTGPGPYPVSMVTVPGAAVQNPSPPTLALMTLAAAQLGLVGLVAGPSRRWLERPRPWTGVVAVNAVILTVYLWHLVAALLGALALGALGLLPPSDAGSGAWWLGRIPWLAVLTVALVVLLVIFGRVEMRPRDRVGGLGQGTVPPAVRAAPLAYLASIVGVLWLVAAGPGPHGPFVMPTGALLLVLCGAGVLRLARTRVRRVAADPGRDSRDTGRDSRDTGRQG